MTRETHKQLLAIAALVNVMAEVLRGEVAASHGKYDARTMPALKACEMFYQDIVDMEDAHEQR